MDNNMKKNARKWLMKGLLAAIIPLTVACGMDYDDDISYLDGQVSDVVTPNGTYDGEWTLNKEVLDTAMLVVDDDYMLVRLPDLHLAIEYFLPLFKDISLEGLVTSLPMQCYPKTVKIRILPQGYSETSQYMSFLSTTVQGSNSQIYFNTYPFELIYTGTREKGYEETPYTISLLSKENAMAVFQKSTRQWTLCIPIDALLAINQVTGESTMKVLDTGVNLYYNTKRKR